MNEITLLIIAMVIVGVYNIAAMIYVNRLLGNKSINYLGFVMLFFSAFVIPLQSYAKIPISIIYLLGFIMLLLILAISVKSSFEQLIFATSNVVFHVIVCNGLVLAIVSLLTSQNMFGLLTDSKSILMINIYTYILAAVILVIFDVFSSRKKVKKLVQHPRYLTVLSTLEISLIALLTVSSFSYYYNLDLVWFSFYHLVVFIFCFVIFYIAYVYFYNVIDKENEIRYDAHKNMAQIYDSINRYGLEVTNNALKMYSADLVVHYTNDIFMKIEGLCTKNNIGCVTTPSNIISHLSIEKEIMQIITQNIIVLKNREGADITMNCIENQEIIITASFNANEENDIRALGGYYLELEDQIQGNKKMSYSYMSSIENGLVEFKQIIKSKQEV